MRRPSTDLNVYADIEDLMMFDGPQMFPGGEKQSTVLTVCGIQYYFKTVRRSKYITKMTITVNKTYWNNNSSCVNCSKQILVRIIQIVGL